MVRIEVTQDNIKAAIVIEEWMLAISGAIQPLLLGGLLAWALPNGIVIVAGNSVLYSADMPDVARDFAHDFRHGRPCHPFTFDLPIDEFCKGAE